MKAKCNNGVAALTAVQAAERLQHIASPIAETLRSFLLAMPARRAKTLPIFEASYGYGQLIVGPRHRSHQFSKVLPPCHPAQQCTHCDRFLAAFHQHRPLTIVLDGSCEEYTEYEQSSPVMTRQAPLRFYRKGEATGIMRFLNEFFLPQKPIRSIFGQPARRMTAGARSIFLTVSVSNPDIARRIPKSALTMYGIDDMSPKTLGKHLDRDHSLFLQLMEHMAVHQLGCHPWQARLLFVSVEVLSQLIATAGKNPEAQSLLLAILSRYYLESLNRRSDFLRQMVVLDRLSDRQMPGYVARTIHHLIEVIRSEFPGFAPHDPRLGNDFGPFHSVYTSLQEAEIIAPRLMDGFPLVLRPAHLGQHQPFIYYSFERPTLRAPVGQIQSVRSFVKQVEDGLHHLVERRRGLFDAAQWEFFVSKGKPQGPHVLRKSGAQEKQLRTFSPYQDSWQIQQDFQPQIQNAQGQGWITEGRTFFGEAKWGFMGTFVRIASRNRQ